MAVCYGRRRCDNGGGDEDRLWRMIRGCHADGFPHITIQLLPSFDLAGLTWSATRAASVKASLTPLLRIALHSVRSQLGPVTMNFACWSIHTKISECSDFSCYLEAFIIRYYLLGRLPCVVVVILFVFFSQVAFQSAQDNLDAPAMFGNLFYPFRANVFERVSIVNLRVYQKAEIWSLSCCNRTLKQSIIAWVSS